MPINSIRGGFSWTNNQQLTVPRKARHEATESTRHAEAEQKNQHQRQSINAEASASKKWSEVFTDLRLSTARKQAKESLRISSIFALRGSEADIKRFFWTDFPSHEDRREALQDIWAHCFEDLNEGIKSVLELDCNDRQTRDLLRKVLHVILGEHDTKKSAQAALRALYLRHHTDRTGNLAWDAEEQEDFNNAFELLNVVKRILAQPVLSEQLFEDEIDEVAPTFAQVVGRFFFKVMGTMVVSICDVCVSARESAIAALRSAAKLFQ